MEEEAVVEVGAGLLLLPVLVAAPLPEAQGESPVAVVGTAVEVRMAVEALVQPAAVLTLEGRAVEARETLQAETPPEEAALEAIAQAAIALATTAQATTAQATTAPVETAPAETAREVIALEGEIAHQAGELDGTSRYNCDIYQAGLE